MKLVSIDNGWVFAKYKIDNREYCLQGSNMFGYDVIEELLRLIYIFIRNEECQRHIVWNQESDFYVGEYLNDNGNIIMRLYYCDKVCDGSVITYRAFNLETLKVVFEEKKELWLWAKEMYMDICKLYNESIGDENINNSIKELLNKISFYFK